MSIKPVFKYFQNGYSFSKLGVFISECCSVVGTPLQNILMERCDGNRNIFHACVTMCTPTSNKEGDQGEGKCYKHMGLRQNVHLLFN